MQDCETFPCAKTEQTTCSSFLFVSGLLYYLCTIRQHQCIANDACKTNETIKVRGSISMQIYSKILFSISNWHYLRPRRKGGAVGFLSFGNNKCAASNGMQSITQQVLCRLSALHRLVPPRLKNSTFHKHS